jgi:hypothetical protein
MSKLVQLVLTLLHSNVEAERIFSIVNEIKIKKRNKIGDNALNEVAIIRSSFQDKGVICTQFEVTKEHMVLHNTNNLY